MSLQWPNQHDSLLQCNRLFDRNIPVSPFVIRRNGLIVESKLWHRVTISITGHTVVSNDKFVRKLWSKFRRFSFSNDTKYNGLISSSLFQSNFKCIKLLLRWCISGRYFMLLWLRKTRSNKSNPWKYSGGICVILFIARFKTTRVFARGRIGGAFDNWQDVI